MFVLLTTSAVGQNLDIKLFEKTKGEKLSEIDKNLAKYKKIKKENKAFLKQQKKKYHAYQDSISKTTKFLTQSKDSLAQLDLDHEDVLPDSIVQLQKLQEQYYLYTNELYSYETLANWDSLEQQSKQDLLQYSEDRLAGNYYYQKYIGANDQVLRYRQELKTYKDSLKSTTLDKENREYLFILKKEELKKDYHATLAEKAEEELKKQASLDFPTDNPALSEALKYQEILNNGPLDLVKMPEIKGKNYFKGKEKVLQSASSKANHLKEKYATVTNSNDLSTAVKRKSLENQPVIERFSFGGNFQIYIDETTSIDLSPEVAYHLDRNWSIGVSAFYRLEVKWDELSKALDQSIYGYRAFSEYRLFSSFFAHLEFESLVSPTPSIPGVEQSNKMNNSFLAGVERRIQMGGGAEAQLALLYNFNYKENPTYTSPWNVRFGFNVNGKRKKQEE